jgi:hypothetical protein
VPVLEPSVVWKLRLGNRRYEVVVNAPVSSIRWDSVPFFSLNWTVRYNAELFHICVAVAYHESMHIPLCLVLF